GDEDDRRRVRAGEEPAEDLETAHAGQVEVAEDEVEVALGGEREASLAAVRGVDGVAGPAKDVAAQAADAALVVDDEDRSRAVHGSGVARAAPRREGRHEGVRRPLVGRSWATATAPTLTA